MLVEEAELWVQKHGAAGREPKVRGETREEGMGGRRKKEVRGRKKGRRDGRLRREWVGRRGRR